MKSEITRFTRGYCQRRRLPPSFTLSLAIHARLGAAAHLCAGHAMVRRV